LYVWASTLAEVEFGHKKRARYRASPVVESAVVSLARGWVLDQFPGRRNPEKCPSTGNFDGFRSRLPTTGEVHQKRGRHAQSAEPAEIGRAPARKHGAAQGSSDRKAEIHGGGVERERDHRGLRVDPDDAGDLSRIERPAREALE